MSALVDMQGKVVATIAALMPDLKECKPHPGRFTREELDKFRVKSPSVHVAVPSIRNPSSSGGVLQCSVKTVLVLTAKNTVDADDKAFNRADAAMNMVAAILLALPSATLGAGIGPCEDISADNLYGSSDDKQGVAMWAIHWNNTVTLSPKVEEGVLPSELYLGFAPDIGTGHEEDYTQIAGGDHVG